MIERGVHAVGHFLRWCRLPMTEPNQAVSRWQQIRDLFGENVTRDDVTAGLTKLSGYDLYVTWLYFANNSKCTHGNLPKGVTCPICGEVVK
jgi:hypothetical protein